MYKIKNLLTGHEFLLPEDAALELKNQYPNDYKIIEKNGKSFKDTKRAEPIRNGSIRDLVIDK